MTAQIIFGTDFKAKAETRSFFAGLTAEQKKAALEYRGDESHGDPRFLATSHFVAPEKDPA